MRSAGPVGRTLRVSRAPEVAKAAVRCEAARPEASPYLGSARMLHFTACSQAALYLCDRPQESAKQHEGKTDHEMECRSPRLAKTEDYEEWRIM